MARVSLIWVEEPGLKGLEPAAVAKAAGVEMDAGGLVEAAVVTCPEAVAPPQVRGRLAGKPVQWLDLAGEVGGGADGARLARAAATVARAAGRAAKGTMPPVYAPQPVQTVLVAGAGLAALTTAMQAAALGHPVMLATPLDEAFAPCPDEGPEETSLLAAQLPAGVEVLPGTELTYLNGAAGGFTAQLDTPEGPRAMRFGAVVLCPPGRWTTGREGVDLPPGLARELVHPLEQYEPAASSDGWRQVAILAGAASPATAGAFARAVERALALQALPKVQVTLFYTEARVASEDGERRFRAAREAGVLCARVAPGGLTVAEGGHRLVWEDPVAGEELSLAPEAVLAAGENTANLPDFLDNEVLWPARERLMPENPRLGGGLTAVSGLYVLGALRGEWPGPGRLVSAAAAVGELHQRLAGAVAAPLPSVRHNHCASCLTCVRVCPHHVVRYVGDDQIEAAPAACEACGMCAAECPAEAIAPPGWSNPELTAGLAAGLERAAAPAMVLFACSRSATRAFQELSRQGHQWPTGLLLMPVVCAGRVGLQLIMKALSLGARRVLVAGCHDGNCRSVNGNLRAKLRVGEVARDLAAMGLAADDVRFLHMASNQPARLAQAVDELARGLD